MKVLVDEMLPGRRRRSASGGGDRGRHEYESVGLAGASDPEVFGAAVAGGYPMLTENVGDFTRIAAQHSTAGGHHDGLLIALSSRFSRRPAGLQPLIAAVKAVADEQIEDRVIYLGPGETPGSCRGPCCRAERVWTGSSSRCAATRESRCRSLPQHRRVCRKGDPSAGRRGTE